MCYYWVNKLNEEKSMTVKEYIEAIKSASTSDEVLALWSRVAAEGNMTIGDIINVHRSCGKIVTEAALEMREKSESTISQNIQLK